MKKLLLTFLIAFITALGLNAEVKTATFDNNDCSGDIASEISIANGDIKISVTKNSNGNGVKYFSSKPAAFRMYGGASMKFTCTNSGEKITKIEFTMSTTNGTWQDKSSSTPTGFNTSTNTWESTEGAQTVTITNGGSSGNTRFTKVIITYGSGQLPTSCEAPTFNFEENAEVTTGDVIKATCSTENSTVYLKVGDGEFEQTDSYTITKSLATGPLKFEAYATVQGKDGIIESDHKILNVNVVKILGNIMYNGEAVPATIPLKGGETLTFTSANAVSMTLVVNGDEANKITTLDTGEISWTAPAATEAADQTYALSITSKLDDAVKTANTTVTVAKKPTVETFELLTDLNDVNEENTYILYGVTKSNNGVMSKSVTSGHFNALSSYTLTDNVITIPADATDVAIITLESNNDGKYYLKTQDNKYIQTSTSSTSLKDTKSGATAFKISVRDAIAHSISIYSGSAYFTYNGNSCSWFKGYSGHQSPTYLYVKRAAQVAPEAPTFTPNGGNVNLFSTVTIACATEGATLTYKIGDGEATAYPADGIKMTEAGKVTITAIATKNGLSTETTKIFNVTDKRREVYVRFDANKYEFTVGEEFKSPVAKACTYNNGDFVEIPNFTETIIYESDNTSVAEVNATTGALTLIAAGTCKITASLESETYKSDPDYYTLTVNKGLVNGTISYKTNTFTYTIGSEATLPKLVKEPADVDVEYSISHKRVENGVAVYNPATIDEQGNITVNTPGIVTVTATVKADRSKTASYVLEIQSLKEAEIAGTGSATPTGNVYTKVVDDNDDDLYENGHLYAILSYHDGKVYAMTPEDAGSNEGLKAVVIKEGVTGFEDTYTIDNSAVANMLFDFSTLCLTYNDNGTLKYLVSPSDRHMQLTAKTPTEPQSFAYNSTKEYPYDPDYGKKEASLLIDVTNDLAIFCNPSQLYFNTFKASNRNFGTDLFNCFLYKVGAQITSASTVKAPVVHITGGNVYYSPDGEWYWGTEDENHELSFANETDGADIYYIKSSATPSSANVRAMANSATGTLYSTPFKKSDLDGKKITFWAEKDGQKSAVETLNFNIKTGIEDIDVENAEAIEEEGDARYFNLQGLEVKNPGEGIYIRVANGKATKILKK